MDILKRTNLEQEITSLKQREDFYVISHYYQDSEVQDVSDFTGSNLSLLQASMENGSTNILVCASKYVADVIAILNPHKKIFVPDANSVSYHINDKELKKVQSYIKNNNNLVTIVHIDSPLELIALADITITSDNAEEIIQKIGVNLEILYLPDKNFGSYLANKFGCKISTISLAYKSIHGSFCERELIKIKTSHPKAKILAHPAVKPKLLNYADFIFSSKSMIDYVQDRNGSEFIILDEPGVITQMRKYSSNSKFYDVPNLTASGSFKSADCTILRTNTIEKLHSAMKAKNTPISIKKTLAKKAFSSIAKMLKIDIPA
ncbi:MAG: quinolinate synthase NadA [Rickettsiaceae bacterium]|nr:quinolinate synthase NadA [Rickettsiaceae bacterium]